MKSTVLRVRILVAAALLIGTLPVVAQKPAGTSPPDQKQPPGGLVIKKTVRRVIVDVVVTESAEKPVRGLTRQDFSVSEDGKPQKILSFDVHNFDTPESIPKLPPLPANTFINVPTVPERGPLYVLLLDLVNTEMADQMTARQQLLKFIRAKPDGTRFAIFLLSDQLRLIQGFTDDKDLLFAAVNPDNPRPHVPKVFLMSRNSGKGDSVLMISVFTDIARYLDGLPGRKNLIWLAGGFPVQIFPSVNGDSPDLVRDMRETIASMARAQVAVYPIDVRGVIVDVAHAPVADSANGLIPITAGGAGAGAVSLLDSDNAAERDIAIATGGHAFFSTNGLQGAIAEATEAGGNYYSLAYSPTNTDYDGGLRKIRVELPKRGYHLSYRRSYYAEDPDAPQIVAHSKPPDSPEPAAARRPGDSLYANMQYGTPMAHQLLFRAHLRVVGAPALGTPEQMLNLAEQPAYFRARRKNKAAKPLPPIPLQSYAIDYTVATRASRRGPSSGPPPPILEIAAGAFDADGHMLNGVVEDAIEDTFANPWQANQPTPPASWEPQGFYRAHQKIDVPLAATTMRIAVRELATDRIGALEIPLPLAPEPQAQGAVPVSAKPN